MKSDFSKALSSEILTSIVILAAIFIIAKDFCVAFYIILLPASCVCMLLVLGKSDELVGTIGAVVEMLEIGLMLITIIPTEQALKKNFDEYGRARSL